MFERGKTVKSSIGLGLNAKLAEVNGILLSEKDCRYIIGRIDDIQFDRWDPRTGKIFRMDFEKLGKFDHIIIQVGDKFKVLYSKLNNINDKVGKKEDLPKAISMIEEWKKEGEPDERDSNHWSWMNDLIDTSWFDDREEKPIVNKKPQTSKSTTFYNTRSKFNTSKNHAFRKR